VTAFDYRQTPILITFAISALVLIYKLAQLQIIDDSYKKVAARTVLDKETKYPSRGNIYTRNGKLLTYNKPIYDLESIYKNIDKSMDTSLFCRLLEIDRPTFESKIEKDWRSKRYHKSLPHTFLSRISPEKYSKFQEQLFRFPGFYPVMRNIRAYPHANGAHLLGYLGEVDLRMIGKKDSDYERGDFVGKSGLEKTYESYLKGQKGVKFLIHEDRGKAFKTLLSDKIQKPLLNRSIAAKYPPGSIFKPILSLIAFQEGVFSPYKSVSCPGYYEYRTFKFGCHNHTRCDNVKSAIMHSCNSYFFEMVRRLIEKEGYNKPELGLNVLRQHLTEFGLGRNLGIDLPNEKSGFVPSPEYYDNLYRNAGGKWRSTYIMSIGIGQGELDLTTLQMANLAAIIANRGFYVTPHLIRGYSDLSIPLPEEYSVKRLVRIDKEHFDPVIEGMRWAILYGTGHRANTYGIPICGKTGTSQNSHGDDHSVFYAFAPKDDPKIALAVYVENAGFGGDIAAPIAGLVIEKYINREVKRTALEKQMTNMDLISKDLPEPEVIEETKKDTSSTLTPEKAKPDSSSLNTNQ